MDTLTAAFAHVCGQARCFVIDGAPLPVCQRCAGLYIGAFATGVWLLLGRAWRRGLPAYGVVCAQALALLVALAGGLHVLDSGPTWRLACGLWTGHVALLWLACGGNQLRAAARGGPAEPLAWNRRQNIAAALAVAVLPALAVLLAALPARGWLIWTAAIVAGAGLLAAAVLAAGVSAMVAGRAWVRHVRADLQPAGRTRLSRGPTSPIIPPPVP
jgi:hypothetical protein